MHAVGAGLSHCCHLLLSHGSFSPACSPPHPPAPPFSCTRTGKVALTRADKKPLKAQREADIAAAQPYKLTFLLPAPPSPQHTHTFPLYTGTGKAALTRADKKRLKAQREADIAAAQRARLAGPGAGPESASGYEQQLLAAPNDSYLWIKYMAFQLKLGECGGLGVGVGVGLGG